MLGLRQLILTLVTASVLTPVMGETFKERNTNGYYLEFEQFQRQESSSAGAHLRLETGQRISLGFTEDNLGWNHPGIIYELSGHGTLGIVFYDDNSPQPVLGTMTSLSTKSDYLGGTLQLLIGQRYGYLIDGVYLEILGGMDAEGWARNIRNGSDRSILSIGRGVLDVRASVTPKLALGVTGWWKGHRERLQIGVKYPAYVQYANYDARELLKPPGQISFYGQIDVTRVLKWRGSWLNLRVFIDSNLYGATSAGTRYNTDDIVEYRAGMRLTFD